MQLHSVVVVVRSLHRVWLFATPWTSARQASLSFTICWIEFAHTHVHWVSDAFQSSHPLSSPSPPVFNLSQHQGLFLWVSSSHQVAKVFSISPSSEFSGLISFRIGWFDLLPVQGTLKSLLQHQFESINALVLSLLYGPTLTSIHDYWKNHSFDQMDFCQQSTISALLYTA